MGIEETPVRDAGRAPAAPASGPLLNISHPPEVTATSEEKPSPAADVSNAAAESTPQTLFVSRQPEGPTPKPQDDIPIIDAGPARIDLMTK